jgi:hypothetical protein
MPEESQEESVHLLHVDGTGFFSKGSCTGCGFVSKGHPDDIRRRWMEYHPDGGARVIEMPRRLPIPAPSEDPFVQKLECRIIVLLTQLVDFKRNEALYVAAGIAQARAVYLGESNEKASEYVSTMMGRIAHLSRRTREKMRHPSRIGNREEQQLLLEGEIL